MCDGKLEASGRDSAGGGALVYVNTTGYNYSQLVIQTYWTGSHSIIGAEKRSCGADAASPCCIFSSGSASSLKGISVVVTTSVVSLALSTEGGVLDENP